MCRFHSFQEAKVSPTGDGAQHGGSPWLLASLNAHSPFPCPLLKGLPSYQVHDPMSCLRDGPKASPSSLPSDLAGVAQWIEHQPVKGKAAGLIPYQGTCLSGGPGHQLVACERQLINVSLTHRCFSLPSPLSKKK